VKFQQDKPHALRTPFEKWLHILKFGDLYESGLEILPDTLKEEEGIEMALDGMRKAYASDEVREMIEMRLKAKRDEASRMQHALQTGRQEGRLDVARRMLAQGLEREVVMKCTGLGPDELPETGA
jgi:predicted transposase/invertase (TIGR01784 family)